MARPRRALRWLEAAVKLATDECILYPFSRFRSGYGQIKVDGKNRTAHSVAFELAGLGLAPGEEIRHSCGVRHCVNRRHLLAGTAKDNAADRDRHGRTPRGPTHGRAKLDIDDVRQISESAEPWAALAARFGVTKGTIGHIKHGRTWQGAA